jgi:hypothetical protein
MEDGWGVTDRNHVGEGTGPWCLFCERASVRLEGGKYRDMFATEM